MTTKFVIVGMTPHDETEHKRIEEELKAQIESVKRQYCFTKQEEEPKLRIIYTGKSDGGKDDQCTPLNEEMRKVRHAEYLAKEKQTKAQGEKQNLKK